MNNMDWWGVDKVLLLILYGLYCESLLIFEKYLFPFFKRVPHDQCPAFKGTIFTWREVSKCFFSHLKDISPRSSLGASDIVLLGPFICREIFLRIRREFSRVQVLCAFVIFCDLFDRSLQLGFRLSTLPMLVDHFMVWSTILQLVPIFNDLLKNAEFLCLQKCF